MLVLVKLYNAGKTYLIAVAMQPLNAPDRTEGECEAIPARTSTVRLTSKAGRCCRASSLEKACRLRREAQVTLTQMKLSSIVIASVTIPVFLSLSRIWTICHWRRYSKLCIDLLQRILGIWQSELVSK